MFGSMYSEEEVLEFREKNPKARGRIFKSKLWYVGVGNEDD